MLSYSKLDENPFGILKFKEPKHRSAESVPTICNVIFQQIKFCLEVTDTMNDRWKRDQYKKKIQIQN